MTTNRTALILRCSRREAKVIRDTAKRERRTISGFILSAVMNHINAREKAQEMIINVSRASAKANAAALG